MVTFLSQQTWILRSDDAWLLNEHNDYENSYDGGIEIEEEEEEEEDDDDDEEGVEDKDSETQPAEETKPLAEQHTGNDLHELPFEHIDAQLAELTNPATENHRECCHSARLDGCCARRQCSAPQLKPNTSMAGRFCFFSLISILLSLASQKPRIDTESTQTTSSG